MRFRPLPILLFFAAAHSVTPYPGDDPCRGMKDTARRAACYQKRYAAADRELNAVYKKLKSSLEADVAAEMQEDSRQWIRYKEYLCGFQAEMEHNYNPPETPNKNESTEERNQRLEYEAAFHGCALSYTETRTEYLRKAFGGEGVSPGPAGTYADSFGGTLRLKETQTAKQLEFQLEVVRGPTHHIGEIGGKFDLVPGRTSVYAERTECAGDVRPAGESETPCCRIEFTFHATRPTVSVKATGCEYYRGARAYFDGDFRKIR